MTPTLSLAGDPSARPCAPALLLAVAADLRRHTATKPRAARAREIAMAREWIAEARVVRLVRGGRYLP